MIILRVCRKGVTTRIAWGDSVPIPDVGDSIRWEENHLQWYGLIGYRLFEFVDDRLTIDLMIAPESESNTFKRYG